MEENYKLDVSDFSLLELGNVISIETFKDAIREPNVLLSHDHF